MDLFLRACGAGGPLQLRLDWPGSSGGECLSFDTPYVVIGRDRGSDLVLEHGEVGNRHAYLQLIDGHLCFVDLAGEAGTEPGDRQACVGWIGRDEAIQVGPYQVGAFADEGEAPGQLADHDLPTLILELSHQGGRTSECPLAGGMALVGGSSDCQVRLLDPGVSSIHCSLVYTALGVWAVDLLGQGGIRVNGTPVRHARLYEGDELQIGGSSTIRVRAGGESDASYEANGTSWRLDPPHEAHAGDLIGPEEPASSGDRDDEPEPAEEGVPASCREAAAPAGPTAGSVACPGDLLAEESAKDRRGSCRYPVADVTAVLSWYEPVSIPAVIPPDPKEVANLSAAEETIYAKVMGRWPGNRNGTQSSRTAVALGRDPMPSVEVTRKSCVAGARLVDISQTGIQVVSEAVPPADQRVWLRLESPQPSDWVEVVMKGTSPEGQGKAHRVRLAFLHSCPYDFFKVVVYRKPGA
jgi:hypothetical protein